MDIKYVHQGIQFGKHDLDTLIENSLCGLIYPAPKSQMGPFRHKDMPDDSVMCETCNIHYVGGVKHRAQHASEQGTMYGMVLTDCQERIIATPTMSAQMNYATHLFSRGIREGAIDSPVNLCPQCYPDGKDPWPIPIGSVIKVIPQEA